MKKMLFFHHSETIGGAGISALNVLKSLDKGEYEITVYCTSNNGIGMADIFEENGFKVIRAGNSPKVLTHFSGTEKFIFSPFFIKNIYDVILDYPKISKIISKFHPDLVVVNSLALFWIAPIAKKNNCETIVFFRETYAKGIFGLRTFLIKKILNKYVDKIAFNSSYEEKESKSIKSLKKVIYNVFDPRCFDGLDKIKCREKLGLNTKEFYILFVGGIIPYKGALLAIKALSQIENKDIKLLFLGYEWNGKKIRIEDKKGLLRKIKYLLGLNYEANCINEIVKYDLEDRILFYPLQKDVAPFFKASDALVFPMTKPHQARPVIEAGFARIPVIISDFPQVREFCDESTSYLFRSGNSKMLANRVMDIYNDKILAEQKIESNYQKTLRMHDFTKYKKEITDFFNF